jgi:hypothetical protein
MVGTHYKKKRTFLLSLVWKRGKFAWMEEGMRDLDEKCDVMKLLVSFVLQHPSFIHNIPLFHT